MLLGLSVHFLLFLSSILFFYNWSTFCLLLLSVSRFWFLFSLFLLWQRCGEPLSSSFLLKVQFSWFRDKNSHLKALASFLFFLFLQLFNRFGLLFCLSVSFGFFFLCSCFGNGVANLCFLHFFLRCSFLGSETRILILRLWLHFLFFTIKKDKPMARRDTSLECLKSLHMQFESFWLYVLYVRYIGVYPTFGFIFGHFEIFD